MKVAVASADFASTSGHAGRARRWLVFAVAEDGKVGTPERVELEAAQVFHHWAEDRPHPLDGIGAIIALSAGDGFLKHMEKRGIATALTAETDPAKAVSDYLAECLSAPRPRPIGALLCKTLDLFSKHR